MSVEKEEIIILEFKRFELRDKPLIDKYFEQHHYEASDNCFTTLYMWQEAYGIRWAEENGVLYIQGGGSAIHSYYLHLLVRMRSSSMVYCVQKNGL